MAVRGIFTSHAGLSGDITSDTAATVLEHRYGGTAPLLALSSGMPKIDVTDAIHSWFEDLPIEGNQQVTAAAGANATTINVDGVSVWQPQTIIFNTRTGEHLLITAVASNNTSITVVRGIGGTIPTAMNVNDNLQLIASAYPEASDKPDAISVTGISRVSYVQLFKQAWAVSGTAKHIAYKTGKKVARNTKQCFAMHAEGIERAFIFGRRHTDVINGNRFFLTDGLKAQIEGYGGQIVSANTGGTAGNFSMADLREFLRGIFDRVVKGYANERIAFCSSKVLLQIQEAIRMDSQYAITEKDTKYGLTVYTVIGVNGELKIMTHPALTQAGSSDLIVFHPALVSRIVMRSGVTEEYTSEKSTTGGLDADSGYILDEVGLKVSGVACMGIMKNMQQGVAS